MESNQNTNASGADCAGKLYEVEVTDPITGRNKANKVILPHDELVETLKWMGKNENDVLSAIDRSGEAAFMHVVRISITACEPSAGEKSENTKQGE